MQYITRISVPESTPHLPLVTVEGQIHPARAKYPGSKHNPKPNCKHCQATGEIVKPKRTISCICMYVDHDLSDQAADMLSNLVKKLKAEIKK